MLSENGLFTVIVVGRQDETSEVVTLELALPDAGDLPAWTPGAHVDIAGGTGAAPVLLVRGSG